MKREQKKVIVFSEEARKRIRLGVEVIGNAVRKTLGPFGQNVLLERERQYPQITNDGVTIARQVILEDPIADMAAQVVLEAAEQTAAIAGDGTTTSVVIAQKIVEKGFERLSRSSPLLPDTITDIQGIAREVKRLCEQSVGRLKQTARSCTSQEDLVRVATVAVEQEAYGNIIGKMVYEVGLNGFITVEDTYLRESEHEIVRGMKFYGSYANAFILPLDEKKRVTWENAPILVTNQKIETGTELVSVIDLLFKSTGQAKFVVVAEKYGRAAIERIIQTNHAAMIRKEGDKQTTVEVKILALKAPALTIPELEDINHFAGGTFINFEKGMELSKTKLEDLGRVEKIIVDLHEIVLMGGQANPMAPLARIEQLKKEMAEQTQEVWINKYRRRIANLSAGIGVIRVGAPSEVERHYWKYKIDDAVAATRCALEEGVLPGGGMALWELAEEFKDTILYEALKAPYEQLCDNAGRKVVVSPDILDPLKVTRLALENACSVAAQLLTTHAAIADKPPPGDIAEAIRSYRTADK